MARERKFKTDEELLAYRRARMEEMHKMLAETGRYSQNGRPKGSKNKPKDVPRTYLPPTKQIRIYKTDNETLLVMSKRMNTSVAEVVKQIMGRVRERNPELITPIEPIKV